MGDIAVNKSRADSVITRKVVMTRVEQKDQNIKIVSERNQQKEVLVEGDFVSVEFPSGMLVQGGSTVEKADANVLARANPCVMVSILLEGDLEFGYDDREYSLSAVSQQPDYGSAIIVNLKRSCTFRRRVAKGHAMKKVNIILKPEWFDRQGLNQSVSHRQFEQIFSEHLSQLSWQPPASVVQLCKEILAADDADLWLHHLYIENRATQVVYEMVNYVVEQAQNKAPTSVNAEVRHTYDVITEAVEYLENHLFTEISLEEVAKYLAMSVSALQRKFKQELGFTVVDYVRNRRLESVMESLKKERISISEAAYMAGYNHPSNFITAFKRKFGVTPGEMMAESS